ncbi:GntR family transcriptional regulator [Streptomyces carminius]|uniref:GntR family transcriptional regulator n=1 Tax=Streptomyces carminius TaxID=2665496 RepID=A0A2M8MC25_9ACTN|nr:PLP-dependent aminotransferase family protein [Streptomyces carminius]PJE97930.1 GntR family transcriptional regulator [Streptomyces carminius]PJF01757.1 GntR family transcriptional regulator [Streptomyces carminius]
MGDKRTTSGPEPPGDPAPGPGGQSGGAAAWGLLPPLASAPPRQRGHTLRERLREAVRSGRLAPGTRLPSSRELAADLGVSRGLVTEAYEQLTAEGYLTSSRGAGTWVGDAARTAPAHPPPAGERAPEPVVDFRPGSPDPSLFPRAAWAAAHRRALARLPYRELGYPDPRGLPALRAALAALLARRRGVVAEPDRVVVCSGVAQAMTLLGLALRGREHRTVAAESPGSPEHTALFAAAGLATVPVGMDAEGLVPQELTASGARAAVVTPAHQFPSGIAYSAARRSALLRWARTTGGLLIEDDYDGDFRYDRAPISALQGLDPRHVAYTSSVSKSLAPGLRLGWLVVPDRLAEEVVERKRTMDLGHPVLDQALLADFVSRGDYDRQLRRCGRAYRQRRDALLRALAGSFEGAETTGIAAGLHVIVTLPARYGPEERFLARTARVGVAVRPLSHYGASPPGDGHVRLVLGYAHLTPGRIAHGVRLLAEAARPGPGRLPA